MIQPFALLVKLIQMTKEIPVVILVMETKYQDQTGTTKWAWKLNPPTVQKIFQLQDNEE
jgi:hypothetical protein